MTRGYNRDRWIAHFLCDCTRMNYVYTLTQKSSSLVTVRNFVALILRRYSQNVQVIRLDGETSLSTNFNLWTSRKGIVVEKSAPYTPAQNGAAERSGKELIVKTRAMRIGSNIPEDLWPETSKTAGYLLNRTPNKTLQWKSPIQTLQAMLSQEKELNLSYVKIFGCRAYALRHKIPRTQKTEPRAYIGHLVGYDSTNIFRIWISSKKKVVSTRDVTFNEELFYDPRVLDVSQQLRKGIEEIIEVFEFPRFQQQEEDIEHDSDTDSDIDPILNVEDEDQQEEDLYQQEQRLQEQVRRETYEQENDTLPGAFPDDFESITGGYDLILPTSERTPEPSSARPVSRPTSKPTQSTN